jgi:hypothetical protein
LPVRQSAPRNDGEAPKASPASARIACRRISPASRLFPPRCGWAHRIFRTPSRCGYCPASRRWPCAPWFRGSGARPLPASTASTSASTCRGERHRSSLIHSQHIVRPALLRKNCCSKPHRSPSGQFRFDLSGFLIRDSKSGCISTVDGLDRARIADNSFSKFEFNCSRRVEARNLQS